MTRSKSYEELLASEERLRTLIEAMPDPVFLKDGEGRWLEVNRAACEAFDVRTDYHGKTDADLAEESDFFREAHLTCVVTDAAAWLHPGTSRTEEVIPRRDGTSHTYDAYKVPLFYPDGRRKALVVLGRDITERKRAEEGLRASERQLRRILATTLDAILLIDRDDIITYMNCAAEKLLGVSVDEAVGKSWKQGPWTLKLPTGELIAHTREPVSDAEVIVIRADGTQVITSMNAAPLDEPPGAMVVAARDITARAELVALKSAFLQVASHELRTPLTPLRLCLQRTADRVSRGEQIEPEAIARMRRQTDRLTALVNELVDLVRLEHGMLPLRLQHTELVPLVREVVDEYRNEAKGRAISFTAPHDARGDIDPERVSRVVGSLIDNAIKYTEGPIDVRLETDPRYVVITIEDHGEGIPLADRAAIFSRFFRVGQGALRHGGLGLGLALARETIRQHHGDLSYAPRDGGGSVFTITLDRVG